MAILLTCFNDGATLREAVASVRATAARAELVVIDDGSSDPDTLRLLAALEAEGTRVIRQTNQGPAAAAMAGVCATSAPYLLWLAADDVLEAGGVDALADELDRSTADAAWGDVVTFGLTSFRIPGIRGLDPWLVTFTNCIPATSLLRRSSLLAAGGWALRDGFEDWDLWMALAETGCRGVHVPVVVYRYRRDQGGRLAGSLANVERFYAELASRHPGLFAARELNRRASAAPRRLKLLVGVCERLPISRLAKIQLAELLARMLWGGGTRAITPMVAQALVLRVRRRAPRGGA